MASQLCVSVHFLDRCFHGQTEGGQPEWPPSPLRVFQALFAAWTARLRSQPRSHESRAPTAFRWIEACPPPVVVTPATWQIGRAHRIAVPNNDLDLLWLAWAKGSPPARQANELKTLKSIHPIRWTVGDTIRYLWALPEPITDEVREHLETLCATARSVVALGWGIDMVVAHGEVISEEDAAGFPGERWLPVDEASGKTLRVPKEGTLGDLVRRHERFLSRLHNDDRGRTTFAAPRRR